MNFCGRFKYGCHRKVNISNRRGSNVRMFSDTSIQPRRSTDSMHMSEICIQQVEKIPSPLKKVQVVSEY